MIGDLHLTLSQIMTLHFSTQCKAPASATTGAVTQRAATTKPSIRVMRPSVDDRFYHSFAGLSRLVCERSKNTFIAAGICRRARATGARCCPVHAPHSCD